jgi:coenzyme F420-reducing hydrogenase delta subunit
MRGRNGFNLALFYCQNISESSEADRKSLEEKYGESLRLHVIPCSGRVETLRLLQSLEEFADAVCVVACTIRACRYFEENRRAKKRVERAQWIIESIGLEKERIGLMIKTKGDTWPLAKIAEDSLVWTSKLGPSPIHQQAGLEKSRAETVLEKEAKITAEQKLIDEIGRCLLFPRNLSAGPRLICSKTCSRRRKRDKDFDFHTM